ncbi:MAG: adhesin [Lonepinella koalarum]|nr:adhesin [Lonepinella koalarum]
MIEQQTQERTTPSVDIFEQTVAAKNYELACLQLLDILEHLDRNFGLIHTIEFSVPQQLNLPTMEQERTVYFCTRMANAITILFSDKNLEISESGALRFFTLQRWLAFIFASSPYINADHILQTYNLEPNKSLTDVHIEPNIRSLVKFCICYFLESNLTLNLDKLWEIAPHLCASLCFALQSPRFIGTLNAFSKRTAILQWFPAKLAMLEDLNNVPNTISHDVYMHCSYDVAENKHWVKKSLNTVIRHHLLKENQWQDRQITQIGTKQGKPVMLVLLEHFHGAHSIYRTHSTSLIAAKSKFYLIGIGNAAVDDKGRAVFDEFHELKQDTILNNLSKIKRIADENQIAVLYMPSIGMDLLPIFASNTKLAPIQAIALGHPATTHSELIDYVIVEDDYVGSESCFSETLLRLPKDALPYVPSALAPTKVRYHLRENPDVVHIGIASTTMKLNPYFLEALQTILQRAQVKIHFHFAMGQSQGIVQPYVERFIKSYLGNQATAYPHLPYHQYLDVLHQCDMMLNPFPFGNTNGIIDMVTLGLVGVCKTGAEVHEHIDEGLFKRLGLPEWLIANTVEDYVERAIRLAENHRERLNLRRHIIKHNGLKKLFTGNPNPMGEILYTKLQEWAVTNNIDIPQP